MKIKVGRGMCWKSRGLGCADGNKRLVEGVCWGREKLEGDVLAEIRGWKVC